MKLMTFFESMTGAKVKDCIVNDKILFIVEENDVGKAIGKNGSNIKRVENRLKKRIKVVGFSNDAVQFVRNLIYPIDVAEANQENAVITLHGKDTNTKAMLIGRDRQNINHLTSIVKRYFDIQEIKIL